MKAKKQEMNKKFYQDEDKDENWKINYGKRKKK